MNAARFKQRCGGNRPVLDERLAAGSVLAHEIQHANQSQIHSADEMFYRTKAYDKRPCEREARQFADENMTVVASILGLKVTSVNFPDQVTLDHGNPVLLVTEHLLECEEVSKKDIVEELRSVGANNAVNVGKVTKELSVRGVVVV